VQARKFHELNLDGTQAPLVELKPVETQVRSLRADSEPGTRDAEIIALVAGERSHPGD
jgi:hypothetical protein